jgi:hypothetical protein
VFPIFHRWLVPQLRKEQQYEEVKRGKVMLDIIFVAATALFFTLGIFYVRGCERLK